MTTRAEKLHMEKVANLPCAVSDDDCQGRITVHHCGTYMGGGRNHFNTIALCEMHHLGPLGIDGKRMGKRTWESIYGYERELLAKTRAQLGYAEAAE